MQAGWFVSCRFLSLKRRQGPQPGDDRVQVGFAHLTEIDLPCHRQLELASVARYAMRERVLDLGIATGADPRLGVRSDVGDRDGAERAFHHVAALAVPVPEIL